MKHLFRLTLCLLFVCTGLHAQPGPSPAQEATPSGEDAKLITLLTSLKYQHGEVVLGDKLATINVPDSFSYLSPADTKTVLVDLWGNPPFSEPPLGMLIPAGMTPVDETCWAVVITYEASGYVKDDDAAKINYDSLLKEMKKGTSERNQERVKQGYRSVELIGWAAPPRYDAVAKKLYWAKELKIGAESQEHTLNYDIRVLGRRGVLSLNCVANISQLPLIEKAQPQILAMVDFNQGNRYADFNPSSDHVAEYGLAALVAGGVAAKAGFFKVLLAGIIALKKFVIIGVVAVVAFLKKLFSGKKNTPPGPPGPPRVH